MQDEIKDFFLMQDGIKDFFLLHHLNCNYMK